MAISKKLEIIYHNGQPDGIRSIRRHLSTMTTYVIPRPLLSEAKKLTGINRPGIYYLISETDDNKIAQIYVGQTRNGVSRLDDHNRSKDFWNKAIMFLADSKTFSLDMISGLEAFAIGKAIEAKRYKVENTVNPKYEIDEYDLPLIEEVYEEIKFIMATQGYKMENSKTTLNEANTLHTTRNGVQALGVYDGEKFEVLEGSEIDLSRKCHSDNIEKLRQTAIQNGNSRMWIRVGSSKPLNSAAIRCMVSGAICMRSLLLLKHSVLLPCVHGGKGKPGGNPGSDVDKHDALHRAVGRQNEENTQNPKQAYGNQGRQHGLQGIAHTAAGSGKGLCHRVEYKERRHHVGISDDQRDNRCPVRPRDEPAADDARSQIQHKTHQRHGTD